jgi:hypothetical protein
MLPTSVFQTKTFPANSVPTKTALARSPCLLASVAACALVISAAAAHAQTTSSSRPGTVSCSKERTLRSLHSREPTSITFINTSKSYRSLNWMDFKGMSQSYGGLNSGEKKTIKTFRTHPWVIATGPGDCLQIFMPSAEPSTVRLK